MFVKWLVLLSASLLCADAIPSNASTDPNDYGLFRRIPNDCDIPAGCTYFAGLRVNEGNDSYLDVYLSGEAMGWVAIGFSDTSTMQRSDVLGCNRLMGSEDVVVVDTYNQDGVNENGGRILNNVLDPQQDDIVTGTTQFVNGRITCTFSRLIAGLDSVPIDFNLDNDLFFLFGYADRLGGIVSTAPPTEGLARLEQHMFGDDLPTILGMFNAVRDTGELPLAGSGQLPDGVTTPVRDAVDYRLRRRDPDDCDPESCDYFMGIDTNVGNSNYLDFYLTADINGWVAVGFSRSANMFDADVVGCNRLSGDELVFAVDTYNTVSGSRANLIDTGNGSDIFQHDSSFADGRITCIFSRRIVGVDDAPEDRELNRDYYFLFGLGDTGGGMGRLPDHSNRIPLISDGRFNPATDSGDIGISRFRQQLLQAHGILMLIAWPVLAFTAIFFAVYMKQALPNGEWFQVHRAFHIAALFVATIGFILAFVANTNSNTPGLIDLGSQNKSGTAHFVLGIIIMALQIANPIISIFRCKPNGNYRWIFNLIHGFIIGLGVEFLAYTNIGIGVSIFSETESDYGDLTILWVYLAFVVFAIVLNSGLLLFFTSEAVVKGEEGTKLAPAVVKPLFSAIYGSGNSNTKQSIEMNKPGESEPKSNEPPPRKPASADSPIRWIGLGLFLGVMIPFIVAVIIMIAVTGNTD